MFNFQGKRNLSILLHGEEPPTKIPPTPGSRTSTFFFGQESDMFFSFSLFNALFEIIYLIER